MKIELSVSIGLVGCHQKRIIEFDGDDWNGMTESDQEAAMLDILWESGIIDWSYKVKE